MVFLIRSYEFWASVRGDRHRIRLLICHRFQIISTVSSVNELRSADGIYFAYGSML